MLNTRFEDASSSRWEVSSGFYFLVLLWTPKRQKLIEKARELNTSDFPVIELQERIREICFEYLIEAQVDGDRLLGRGAWRVRSIALGHGVGCRSNRRR